MYKSISVVKLHEIAAECASISGFYCFLFLIMAFLWFHLQVLTIGHGLWVKGELVYHVVLCFFARLGSGLVGVLVFYKFCTSVIFLE